MFFIFISVSYTHLDVYKRQNLRRVYGAILFSRSVIAKRCKLLENGLTDFEDDCRQGGLSPSDAFPNCCFQVGESQSAAANYPHMCSCSTHSALTDRIFVLVTPCGSVVLTFLFSAFTEVVVFGLDKGKAGIPRDTYSSMDISQPPTFLSDPTPLRGRVH